MVGRRPFAPELSLQSGPYGTVISSDNSSAVRKQFARGRASGTLRIVLFIYFGFVCTSLFCPSSFAQERPYIVTYDHYVEEPGSLEVEYFSTFGTQRAGNDFHSFWAEFEYGATAWWTTELYVFLQSTFNDSTIFTGFRWENRVRLLQQEHFINPVFYFEYEHISGADKILKEIEGHD